MEENNVSNKILYVCLFFAVILIGVISKLLASVIMPVVIAVLFTFVLLPLIKKINSFKIPWALSSVLVVILFVVFISGILSLLVNSLSTIVAEYPKYESKFMTLYSYLSTTFGIEFDEGKSFAQNLWKNLKVQEYAQKTAVFLSSGAVSFVKNMFTIVLMILFLAIELKLTKQKMRTAFTNDKEKVSSIANQIAEETIRYVSIKFFISLATGILAWLVTMIIGMDFPIVWGFLSFLMNFVPIFGSIIAVGITTLFAALQFYPNFAIPAFILIFLIAVNQILGTIIEPRIEGKNLGLSPFVILVCLSFWGYIWGFLGMLLAVPVTVIIKIVCENIKELKIIAIVLGNNKEKEN